MSQSLAIIGGGAAGFFAAISAAELNPDLKITIFEKGRRTLTKVKVSGGGRCNVTHACFDPRELVQAYPRGSRELLGAFHKWQPNDMIDWFTRHGVALKTEDDGRIFPQSDSSKTIIDCFLNQVRKCGIQVKTQADVKQVVKREDGAFELIFDKDRREVFDKLLLATGGSKANQSPNLAQQLGHQLTPLAPSLFTFHIDDSRIKGLPGISVPRVCARCKGEAFESLGPLLITHWGLSGPAILKLSALGARHFATLNYKFELELNWLGNPSLEAVLDQLNRTKKEASRRKFSTHCPFDLPKRLWTRFMEYLNMPAALQWAQVTKKQVNDLAELLVTSRFQVIGKSMNKEEFVTCGGVDLAEVDFKTMQSKIIPELYFAGEALDIDGITGGYNFQAAWTTARLAAEAIK